MAKVGNITIHCTEKIVFVSDKNKSTTWFEIKCDRSDVTIFFSNSFTEADVVAAMRAYLDDYERRTGIETRDALTAAIGDDSDWDYGGLDV